jgi:multidrug efflux system membrane fusion protein
LTLSYTTINAPYDGHVGYLDVDEGNIVGVGENTLLATLNRYEPLHIYFDVSENIVLRALEEVRANRTLGGDVKNKLKIEVSFEGEDGYPHKGYLDVLDNEIDSATGTALVRGVIPNTQSSFDYYQKNGTLPDFNTEADSEKPQEFPLIMPGAYAEIRVIGDNVIEDACLIDERAIGTDLLGKYLLTVGSDNIVTLNRIEMGQLYQGFRHIIRLWDPDKETMEAGVGQVDTRGKNFSTDFKYIIKGLQRARPGKEVKASVITSAIPDVKPIEEAPETGKEGPGT